MARTNRTCGWLVTTIVVVLGVSPGLVHAELDQAEFERLHKLLTPAEDAAWRTIPWTIELLDAQAVAAEKRKPIFIWAMDGHPLGCT